MRKLFTFLVVALFATLSAHAGGPTYASGMAATNATGAVSTERSHNGVQSYKFVGAGSSNPKLTITVNDITDWTTITKVTMWVYSTGSWGGQFWQNSSSTGFTSGTYSSPTANTWTLLTYDLTKTFALTDGWGQIGFDLWKTTETQYLDEIKFYNSSGTVLYEIDATDMSVSPTSITVTPSPISAIIGKKQQLTVAVTPSDASTAANFTSNDASATVSGTGLVTTVSAGTAVITATSALDANVSGSSTVTVNAPDVATSLVYANFENGLGNFDGAWASWNNNGYSGPTPTAEVVANPFTTGNPSANVLKVSNCYQWGGFAVKSFDLNKINTIKFKVYTDTAITDLKFQYGVNGGVTPSATSAIIPANTWTTLSYTVSHLEAANKQFAIQLASNGSQEASSGKPYRFYIDSITYIAGDGSTFVPVTGIDITTTAITTDNATLQLAAAIAPATATNQIFTLSLVNASANIADTAIFDANAGTLKAVRNGSVKVKAVTTDGGFVSEKIITITGQRVPVDSLKLKPSASFPAAITANGGKLRIDTIAYVYPADATNNKIKWSLRNDNVNQITETGELTAFKNGPVWVIAVSDSNALAIDSILITMSNQVLVSDINLTTDGAAAITTNGGQLQVTAEVLPADARIKDITWSIVSAGGLAIIDQTGLVTAAADGNVYAKASAIDESGVADSILIAISNQVAVQSVTLSVEKDTISVNDGTLTLQATVAPAEASVKTLKWRIIGENNGLASIDSVTGTITAMRNGSITVRATALANASIFDEAVVEIMNQIIEPTSILVYGQDNADTISVNNGTLALFVTVTPADAVNDMVWSIVSEDADTASISVGGLVTAIRNGSVTVQASSTVANLFDQMEITLIDQVVEPTSLTIKGTDNATSISVNDGTLQMLVEGAPADADLSVEWSLAEGNANKATISANGLVTALRNGTITVIAVSTYDETIVDSLDVTITNQIVEPTALTVKGTGNATTITTKAGTLQMLVEGTPADADLSVVWSVATADAALADISASGLLTAKADGAVTVIATSSVVSSLKGEVEITISGQVVLVSEIVVTSAGGATEIASKGGTLQLTATVSPSDAANKAVTWSSSKTSVATVSTSGLVTAVADGSVTITATAKDGSAVSGSIDLTVSNQVGINQTEAQQLSIYPNPAKDVLYIVNLNEVEQVQIISASGAVVKVANNVTKTGIDIQDLKPGVYVVKAVSHNTVYQSRFVKN